MMPMFDRLAVGQKQRDVDILMATATKHYIRRDVWLPVAKKRHHRVGRPIQYFTLTTADLFDVKLLERAGIIETNTRGYPGIGFCEMNDKTYTDIMRGLRWCKLSHKGTFEELTRQQDNFDSRFAFDVVNLDFITVPFRDMEAPLEGTWGAVRRVLEIQKQNCMSFDLFLTFRGSRHGTNDEAINELADLLQQNLQTGLGVEQFSGRIGHTNPTQLLDEDYVTFLCMGLPKLLVGDAIEIGFQISRADVYSYPRTHDEGEYRIVKFVLGLEIPLGNQRRLSEPPSIVVNYNDAVTQVFAKPVVDVGEILDMNPELRDDLDEDLDSLKIV